MGRADVLTGIAALGSILMAGALGGAYVYLRSDLAFAQAADSLVDVAGAIILTLAVRVGRTPRDSRHPMGHSRAEPLGALAIAALATVLAFEVGKSAVATLLGRPDVRLTGLLLGLFVAKVVFKAVLFAYARADRGPAVRALAVDARNDMLVGAVAVIGFFAARFGARSLDAGLALPLALWIGWSGLALGKENIDLLMGIAPSQARQGDLLALAASVPGVIDAHDLRAHYLGSELSVHVHISVPGELTVRQGHDIGEAVRVLLFAESDVVDCTVHVDPVDAPD